MINRFLLTLWLALPAIASAQPNPEVMQAAGKLRTVLLALDTNSDQQLSQSEVSSATERLRSLDANGDGRLSEVEMGGGGFPSLRGQALIRVMDDDGDILPGQDPRAFDGYTLIHEASYAKEIYLARRILLADKNGKIVHQWPVAPYRQHEAATDKGGFLYRFGNPMTTKSGGASDVTLFWQHDVHWVADGLKGAGNIMLFNNGNHRRRDGTCYMHQPRGGFGAAYSNLLELETPVRADGSYDWNMQPKIAWSWNSDGNEDYDSPFMCGLSRLPNGNVIFVSSFDKRIIEVTDDGERVEDSACRVTDVCTGSTNTRRTIQGSRVGCNASRPQPVTC